MNSNQENHPRIGWVSTWNTPCGIACYSEHLLEHFKVPVVKLAPYLNTNTKIESHLVKRCWNLNSECLDTLYQQIMLDNLNIIIVQFNYAFFKFDALSFFLKRCLDFGLKVFVTLHSTTDPKDHSGKELFILKDIFEKCHALFIHSICDQRRLNAIGLKNNVTLFPHGILDYKPDAYSRIVKKLRKLFIFPRLFHLSTFGFCLPNKGLPELIKSIKILKDRGYKIKLSLITSLYPGKVSSKHRDELVKLIETLGLDQNVEICTDFLSNNESLFILYKTDLVVFPYQNTYESVSGAVRHGIASRTTVAVTPLPVFEDVSELTFKFNGFSEHSIADGIIEYINIIKSNKINSILPNKAYLKSWREKHLYSKLSIRLQGIIQSFK